MAPVRAEGRVEAVDGQQDLYARGLAHDLANVLAVLSARLELVEHQVEPPAVSDIRRAYELTQEAILLTRQLARHADGGSRRQQPVAVAPVIRQVLESLLADTRVRWQLACHPDTSPVQADPLELERVVRNVVTNAAEAMDWSGPLSVTAANVDGLSGPLGHPAGMVAMSFADAGPGLDTETLAAATVGLPSAKGPDHGFGLRVIHQLVEVNGGQVQIEARRPVGTTVTILWPAWSPGSLIHADPCLP
jgi:two-component system cell cycle sensor histidine kinase/response regulator CckA